MARQYDDDDAVSEERYNPYQELLDDPDEMGDREYDAEVGRGMAIEKDVTLSNKTGKYYRMRSVHGKNDQARRDYLGY